MFEEISAMIAEHPLVAAGAGIAGVGGIAFIALRKGGAGSSPSGSEVVTGPGNGGGSTGGGGTTPPPPVVGPPTPPPIHKPPVFNPPTQPPHTPPEGRGAPIQYKPPTAIGRPTSGTRAGTPISRTGGVPAPIAVTTRAVYTPIGFVNYPVNKPPAAPPVHGRGAPIGKIVTVPAPPVHGKPAAVGKSTYGTGVPLSAEIPPSPPPVHGRTTAPPAKFGGVPTPPHMRAV